VDFTSALNTTDHGKMLMIMYDLGFPTDAIEIVKNLYEEATTQVKHPSGHSTDPILIEGGTVQEDTSFPSAYGAPGASCSGCMSEDVATRTPAFKIRAWQTPIFTTTSAVLPLLMISSVPLET